MKALAITGYGTNDVVSLMDLAPPTVGPRELLVEVHAASVNPIDFKIRSGKLRMIEHRSFPLIMGNDLAGRVERVGADVKAFKPGDLIFARLHKGRIGAFAEYAAVREEDAALKPAQASMEEAAALPLVTLTAWQALVDSLKIGPGKKVLIHAGAGGVGYMAIQIAKIYGAIVATTASGVGLDLVRQRGVDVAIDYTKEAFEDRIEDYDAVFDTIGGDTLERSFKVVRPGGTIASIAGSMLPTTPRDKPISLPVKLLLHFSSRKIRKLAAEQKINYEFLFMTPSGKQLRDIAELVDAGKLRPLIDRVLPLSEGKDALSYVESGRAKGKVIIKIK